MRLTLGKIYKVTYKPYFNERIKPVKFHGKDMHPLYMQVTFDRKTIFFKSYYFDLFTQPRYAELESTIEQITEQESRLIEYITNENADNFSLDKFTEDYKYYATDLLHRMDEPFKDYLVNFFMDEGLPRYAGLVRAVIDSIASIQLVDAFNDGLKPELYAKMVEHAIYYAPPYIPLVAFVRHLHPEGLLSFPIYEWKQPQIPAALDEFLGKSFPEYDKADVKKNIEKLV